MTIGKILPGQRAEIVAVRRLFLQFFLFLLALFLTLGAAITIPNVSRDQYRYFSKKSAIDENFKPSCRDDPQNPWLYNLGRPIAAKMECFVFQKTSDIASLMRLRIGVLSAMALAAVLLNLSFFRILGNELQAFFLTIPIFTLPGSQNTLFMTNFPNAFAPIFALLAYLTLHSAQPPSLRNHRATVCATLSTAVAIIFLLLSLLTYQMLAFFFFLPIVAEILFGNSPLALMRKKIAWCVISFIAALTAYYVLNKYFCYPQYPHTPAEYRLEVHFNGIFDRAIKVLGYIIPLEFNLWNIYTNRIAGVTLALFCCITMLVAVIRSKTTDYNGEQSPQHLGVERFATFTGVLFATNGIWFLTPAYVLFRLTVVPSAIALFGLIWSIHYLLCQRKEQSLPSDSFLKTTTLGILAAGGIVFANVVMEQNVWNSHDELAYMRGSLADRLTDPFDHIHIVLARQNPIAAIGFNGLPTKTDEFNVLTTSFDIPTEYVSMVGLALRQDGLREKRVVDGSAVFSGSAWIRSNGTKIVLTNDRGEHSSASVSGNQINAVDWGIDGIVALGRNEIDWSNGTIWRRQSNQDSGRLLGEWKFASMAKGTIAVTASKPDEPYFSPPGTVVVDMNIPLAPFRDRH